MATAYDRLVTLILQWELEDLGLQDTSQYDPYEDETQNEQSFPQLAQELELMPEVGDLYVGAEIFFLEETRWQEDM